MHSHHPKYVSGFGKIITRPGVIIPLADDHSTLAFGARGDSTLVLMTTNNIQFDRIVNKRREAISSLLSMYARWDRSPFAFMENLVMIAAASNAMAHSAICEIHIDAGSCLYHDDLFVGTKGRTGNDADTGIPAVALRRVCSPALDIFSENYIVKSLSSLIASFSMKSRPDAIAERRKIVASAISILAATAARVAQMTNGRLTYVPDGHCVSVAMLKQRNGPLERFKVHLVINDPVGAGWKVLGDLERSFLDNKTTFVSRLETLIEFSCKCIVDALLMRGMDSACMRRIVESMAVPFYHPKAVGKYPKMTLLTAGNSTVTGEGSVVVTWDGRHHVHLSLTEFQVDIVVAEGSVNTIAAINIEPTLSESNHIVSPSILHWYDFQHADAPDINRLVKSAEGNEREIEDKWEGLPIKPSAPIKTQWRACHISDDAVGVDSWKSKLTQLHKFDWVRTEDIGDLLSADQYSATIFDKIAAASAIVTSKTFTDRSVSNNTDFLQRLNGQVLPIEAGQVDRDLINATTLLCDIYGFDGNENQPIVTLDKTYYPEGATKRDAKEIDALGDSVGYALTLTGNTANTLSIQAIQLLKLGSFSSPTGNFEEEFDELLLVEGSSSACRWYNVSPATVSGHPDDTGKHEARGNQTTMFLFTPRCVYHTSYCYIHLYAVSEGPYGDVKYDPFSRHLTIGEDCYSDDPVDGQGALLRLKGKALLIIAALAARTHLSINLDMSARPLGISKVSYERCRGSYVKLLIDKDSDSNINNIIGWTEIITSNRLNDNIRCTKSFSTDNKIIGVELLLRSRGGLETEESEGITRRVSRPRTGGDLDIDDSLCQSRSLEVKCSSMERHDYYVCPTEIAIRKYGVGVTSPSKSNHKHDDVDSESDRYRDDDANSNYQKATIIMAL